MIPRINQSQTSTRTQPLITHTGKKSVQIHAHTIRKTNWAGDVPYLLRALVLTEDLGGFEASTIIYHSSSKIQE